MQDLGNVQLGSRDVELRLTRRAASALARQARPLYIEMELYFSCMVGKRVNFLPAPRAGSVDPATLSDSVSLGFRASMTRMCRVGDAGHEPQAESYLAERGERYVPRWISLDYRDGEWCGEFGLL